MKNGLKIEKNPAKTLTHVLQMAFSVCSLVLVIYRYMQGNFEVATKGLLFPLIVAAPWILHRLGVPHYWRFYVVGYLFAFFAYCYGSMLLAFRQNLVVDKISHFFSGFIFTILGMCLYAAFSRTGPAGERCGLTASHGLFFSLFVAVAWEVVEFFDYVLLGNDSQNHETTGVFDTMGDLLACLVASLLCAAAYLLWRKKGLKLLTGWVMEEVWQKTGPAKTGKSEQENA